MSFSDFHGNAETVHRLRDMLARKRFPHAVILSGARGSGKYTLALMLAQALNCLAPTETDGLPDFCGQCANCRRIAQAADLDARFAEAVEAREGMRETEHPLLVEMITENLQTYRQAFRCFAARDAHAGDAGETAGDRVNIRQIHLHGIVYFLADVESRERRNRRDDRVDPVF